MKILYGVVGEGMGHAMRSRVILDHLLAKGHEVQIMCSGKALRYLEPRFAHVKQIHGLHMILEDNRVRLGKTLWSNIQKGLEGLPGNISAYYETLGGFEPEVVISDFESWAYLYGQRKRLPTISIDNMQIINRCTHDDEVIAGFEKEFRLTKAFVKSKLPFCAHYLITTFFHPPIRKSRTTLHGPILRPEILSQTPSREGHILVYQTAKGYNALEAALKASGKECRIYGMRPDLKTEEREGNLRYRPFSEETFITDLATADAVISAAGFTLMSEAVWLGKPMLAIPVHRQFEQIMNARYLQKCGYGLAAGDLSQPHEIPQFLEQVQAFQKNLDGYKRHTNAPLLEHVDDLLAQAASGLLENRV